MESRRPAWLQSLPSVAAPPSAIFQTTDSTKIPVPSATPLPGSLARNPFNAAALNEAATLFSNADYLTATYDLNAPGIIDLYDAVVVPKWSTPFGNLLLSQLLVAPRPANAQVLDIACGTGYPTIDIARHLGKDADVVGIDTWTNAIERARNKASDEWLRNVFFLQADIAHAQLPEDQFDLICCNLGYTSFADRGRSLAVMARITRPGGWLLLTTPLQTAFREFLDLYHTVLSELQLLTCVDALVALVKNRPTVATTSAAIERTGMVIERDITDRFTLSFVNARDFLTSPIVALSFMVGWRAIVPDVSLRRLVFNEIERRLDAKALAEHGLHFEIPMLCISARRTVR